MQWGIGGVLCAVVVFSASCKSDTKSRGAAAIPDTGEITASADDLIARRDALLAMRGSIAEERQTLVEKREAIKAEGGDTSEIDDQLIELMQKESELDQEQREFYQKVEEHLSKQESLLTAVAASGAPDDPTAREASVAARESAVASRESRLAEREQALSEREESLATKWKESCAVGTTQTIVQTVDAQGSEYTKKDVEPLLKKARREMSRKGILSSDLPNELQGLENEAAAAMKEADYLRARLAANTLYTAVRRMKIDKAFIASKIQRLNKLIGKRKVDKNIDSLFREATSKYGDGKFSAANKKLNNIYSAIR